MDQRTERPNPTALDVAEETPLRRYLASLDQEGEGSRLLRHIRLYLNSAGVDADQGGRDLALEVLQESAYEALRSEARFDPARSPKAWFLGIAAKVVLRVRKRLFSQNNHELLASDRADAQKPGETAVSEEELFERLVAWHRAGPEDEVLAAWRIEELLVQLTSVERNLIELMVLQEMGGNEAAEALGITPGNARVRLHRTLRKLRAIWHEQEAGREEN